MHTYTIYHITSAREVGPKDAYFGVVTASDPLSAVEKALIENQLDVGKLSYGDFGFADDYAVFDGAVALSAFEAAHYEQSLPDVGYFVVDNDTSSLYW